MSYRWRVKRGMRTSGSNAIPPEDFENETVHIWKLVAVGESGKSVIADGGIDLCLCSAKDIYSP
jgi:hypothetical protein